MKTKEICLRGLMIALVTVSTMVLQIPVSATNGYIHLGDSMILLISVFFGWRYGMVAGGVGAALADLLSGYAHWAPFTLIIKGVMGLLVGKIAHYTPAEKHFFGLRNLAGSVVGIVWMIIGYYFGGAVFAEKLQRFDFHSRNLGAGQCRLCVYKYFQNGSKAKIAFYKSKNL